MTITDDKAVFVDTSVLLSATVPGRLLHRAALTVLNDWPNQGTPLVVSTQVLREYLVVATRPVAVNGLGLSLADAQANVAAFRRRMRLIAETETSWDRLTRLVTARGCAGKQVHDANLVAVALAWGVPRLVTANVGDFAAFTAEALEIVDLATVG